MVHISDTREGMVTGSIAGAIVGQNRYLSRMGAWMKLMGLTPPTEENEAMYWGHALEPVLANRYWQDTGNLLFPHPDLGLDFEHPLVHPAFPWWGGTPDRLIVDDPKLLTKNPQTVLKRMSKPSFWSHVHGIWEGKTAGAAMKKGWDDGQVPPSYYVQVAWYLPILDVQWADISVLIGGQDWRTVTIRRDPELEHGLFDAVSEFLEQHIQTQTPPPVDETPAWAAYLSQLFPKATDAMVEADMIAETLVYDLKDTRVKLKELGIAETRAINAIKAIIGEAQGIKGNGFRVTWKNNAPSRKTNWQAVAESLAANPLKPGEGRLYADLIDQHTTPVPGARVFRPTFDKEEDENGK